MLDPDLLVLHQQVRAGIVAISSFLSVTVSSFLSVAVSSFLSVAVSSFTCRSSRIQLGTAAAGC